jgi:phage baseplate assembly protein W
MFIRQPFSFGAKKTGLGEALRPRNGISLTADADLHLKDKIMAVLFTAPGERVNNPRFGAGLNRAVFEGLNELTLSAIEYRVSEGLRRDVGDEILLDSIDITSNPVGGELLLTIVYRRREHRVAQTLEVAL